MRIAFPRLPSWFIPASAMTKTLTGDDASFGL
jgi:hypothetical protein